MRIGELAREAGVATSALRYYEEAGLFGPAARTESGYRMYPPSAVARLKFIRRAKALGLMLREIRDLVEGEARDIDAGRDRVGHVVAHKLAATTKRITELQTLRRELESLFIRLLRAPGPNGDGADWLPTNEEVKAMAKEVACCGECCCVACACSDCEPCDCPDCPCLLRGEGEPARWSAADSVK